MRGTAEDELVLCTATETFSVSMVETSNTLLLLRAPTAAEGGAFQGGAGGPQGLGLVAVGRLSGQHELKRVVAGVHRLREILREEEWRDPSGSLGPVAPGARSAAVAAGAAAAAALAAAAAGAGGGGEGPGEEEEALALQQLMELEAAEEEGAGGGGARRPPPPEECTLPMEFESSEAAGARAAALEALPFRTGRFDAVAGGLPAPRAARGWTVGELSHVVQGSDAEIRAELARLGAVEVARGSGRFCLLSDAYAYRVLRDACTAARGEGWRADALPLAPLAAALEQHTATVVEAVVRAHAAVGGEGGGGATAALCLQRVAARVADRLLFSLRAAFEARGGGGATPGARAHGLLRPFLDAWRSEVEALWPSPLGAGEVEAAAAPGALATLALLDAPTAPGAATATPLRYFPEAELPAEPAARFAALFAARPIWREADLLPYVEPLAQPPHRKLLDLVATHCRVTNHGDGSRTFSAR